MKTLFTILLFLFFLSSSSCANRIEVLATNSQKTMEFQRRQTGTNEGGDPQFIDFVDLKTGKIIYSFSSIWRDTDGGWSPDGLTACIDDRTATSGDFLYLFRFTAGHPKLLRGPGEDRLASSLSDIYGRRGASGRFTLVGRGFLSDDSLEVRVTGGGYGDESSDFDAVIKIGSSGKVRLDPSSIKSLK